MILAIATRLRFVLPVAACICLFWPVLVHGNVFAFRDTLHFYYPLWHSLDDRAFADWLLPQFNILDRVGTPLIAEPTSMVFYPLRMILRIPGLGLERCIGLFLALHLLIGWYTAYWFVRYPFRRSPFASSMAAWSYTFGGAVYFNIYNPPYLISAAWLPLLAGSLIALLGRSASINQSRKRRTRAFAFIVLSMSAIILGGDFQLPYNVALLTLLFIFALLLIHWRGRRTTAIQRTLVGNRQFPCRDVSVIALALSLAIGITAVQWIPTWYWLRGPTGINAIPQRGIDNLYTLQTLDFLTWISPYVLGNYTPTHTRWSAAYDDALMWTPSLHFGIAMLCGCVISVRYLTSKRIRLIAAIAVFALVLAAGRALGVYSVIASLLPFYGGFRYPMKWYIIAAIAFSLLGAYGVELLRIDSVRRRARFLCGLIAMINLAVVLLIVIFSCIDRSPQTLMAVNYDRLIGAFDARTSAKLIGATALATSISALLLSYILRPDYIHGRRSGSVELVSILYLVLLAWMTTTTISAAELKAQAVPVASWELANQTIPVVWLQRIESVQPDENEELARFVSQPRTALESARFQQQHSVGKFHLLSAFRSFTAQLSLEPSWYPSEPKINWLQTEILPAEVAPSISIRHQADQVTIARESPATAAEITLPILNDGGWKTNQSGVLISATREHLLSIHLPSSVEHVTLSYFAPGLSLGATVSILSIFVFTFVCFRTHV